MLRQHLELIMNATNINEFSENSQLIEKHWQEWVFDSVVDETLTCLNVLSLHGAISYEYLLYALPQTARRNDGRLRNKYLKQYAHIEAGGWWVSGLDPLNNWLPMDWGRFKPDYPRQEWDTNTQKYPKKIVKYESPPKTPNRVTYLRVPLHTWQMLARRYNVPMPQDITITEEGEALGFWAWVVAHREIPIILTEGEKKAGCLLTLGFVAIGLPGIWNGRVGKEDFEKLHPDLIPLAQKERKFVILFDYETKSKTKQQIFQATHRTCKTIWRQDCQSEVAVLPGPEKGIDDWVLALGKKADNSVTTLIADALTVTDYQKSFFVLPNRGIYKYKPDETVNSRYLSQVISGLPRTGLVGLISDMGTGKTELLANHRRKYPKERFLNCGHRVNLLQNLSERLQTHIYSAVYREELGKAHALSITVDSLYKMASNLQAYDCIFIDEACQYLVHLLKSNTCKEHRGEILEVLEYFIYNAKLVVLADAHLNDVTIDFFLAMRPIGEKPYIIKNEWKSGGRNVYWYEGKDSSTLLAQIHAQLMVGKRLMVVSDSKRFIKKLERALNDRSILNDTDDLTTESEEDRQLRIWSIHSENSSSPENISFVKTINFAIEDLDVLLASPSLSSGVDICNYHFDAIFGVFHTISQSATECAQQLWRYRPNVPMYIWAAPHPLFGYAETNPQRIKERILQKNEMTAFLIRIDRKTGSRGAEKDWALNISCEIEAQRNKSINHLRADLRSLLAQMGNSIIIVGDSANDRTAAWIKAAGIALDKEHCTKVANAEDIDRETYENRLHYDYLTPEQMLEFEKYRIRHTYGMTVTPELVAKDAGGQLIVKIIALEAILAKPGETIIYEPGIEFMTPPTLIVDRDKTERDRFAICTDWSNYSTTWLVRHQLGLREILTEMIAGVEFTENDPIIQAMAEFSHRFAPHIKVILNLTIPPNKPPMWILSQYLNQLGLSTFVSRRPKEQGKRVRYYRLKNDELAFAQKVIEYRRQQREHRTHKPQQ